MSREAPAKDRTVAQVDYLVDENGQKLDVPDDTSLALATSAEQVTGATSPGAWWGIGLGALALIVVVWLAVQFATGGNTGTAMIPGTPTAAPQQQTTN